MKIEDYKYSTNCITEINIEQRKRDHKTLKKAKELRKDKKYQLIPHPELKNTWIEREIK